MWIIVDHYNRWFWWKLSVRTLIVLLHIINITLNVVNTHDHTTYNCIKLLFCNIAPRSLEYLSIFRFQAWNSLYLHHNLKRLRWNTYNIISTTEKILKHVWTSILIDIHDQVSRSDTYDWNPISSNLFAKYTCKIDPATVCSDQSINQPHTSLHAYAKTYQKLRGRRSTWHEMANRPAD